MTEYVTKDSGERAQFDSGMQRDTEKGKPRFDLMLAEGVPYEEQMLTRFAALLGRGAEKYDDRNWEKANSEAELARMRSSAFRHFIQWLSGETDEDHAAATIFNIVAVETTQYKVDQGTDGSVKMGPTYTYGPPPLPPAPFAEYTHPDDKVGAPKLSGHWVDAGYISQDGLEANRQEHIRSQQNLQPDQSKVTQQVNMHFNGGMTDQARLAAQIDDDIRSHARRMRIRRAGY